MPHLRLALLGSVLLSVGQVVASPQTLTGASDRFDVVSVKRSPTATGELVRTTSPTVAGNRVIMRNASVHSLVWFAYEPIPGRQIVGGPGWMNDQNFDVEAVSETPLTPERAKLLVRQLLADRFQLRVHRETQERTVFALVLVKPEAGVPKPLVRSTFDCETYDRQMRERLTALPAVPTEAEVKALTSSLPATTRAANGSPVCRITSAPNMVSGGVTMATLAERLSTDEALVLDRTGLKGAYEFTLRYLPERMRRASSVGPPLLGDADPMDVALPSQLGLKLDPQKTPLEVLVVDGIERPSEN